MSTDGSQRLNRKYWNLKCKEIPSDAKMILVEMGSVVDYYRPRKAGMSWCDMLTGYAKHEFSRDGVKWVTPKFQPAPGAYGGSTSSAHVIVPDMSAAGDKRTYLSFWGAERSPGGCCHASYSDKSSWGRAFTIYYTPAPGMIMNVVVSNIHYNALCLYTEQRARLGCC